MIHEFRSASVVPLHLPPFLEKILEENKFKPNKAIRDIFSRLPNIDDQQASYLAIEEIIELTKLIDASSPSVFYYRQGKVPDSVYYLATSVSLIDHAPQSYVLPEDYAELREEFDILVADPTRITDLRISPNAKFCFKIRNHLLLDYFLTGLRDGTHHPDEQSTKNLYNNIVIPAYFIFDHNDALTESIFECVNDINFILNHHDNILCPYIEEGRTKKSGVLSFSENLEALPFTCPEKTKDIFETAYMSFADRYDKIDYDFYYDLSQNLMMPLRLLAMTEPDISPFGIDYMIAYCALNNTPNPLALVQRFGPDIELLYQATESGNVPDDILTHLNLTRKNLQSMSVCAAFFDLSHQTMKIGGPNIKTPAFPGDEVIALYEKIEESEKYQIENPHLKTLWLKARCDAIELINEIISTNDDIASELAPYLPPSI